LESDLAERAARAAREGAAAAAAASEAGLLHSGGPDAHVTLAAHGGRGDSSAVSKLADTRGTLSRVCTRRRQRQHAPQGREARGANRVQLAIISTGGALSSLLSLAKACGEPTSRVDWVRSAEEYAEELAAAADATALDVTAAADARLPLVGHDQGPLGHDRAYM